MSQSAYADQYPRAGNVALLCEGDLVGYEATILSRWLDRAVESRPLVDVWPCGTKEAMYGVSDAIGRARPLLLVEDRDYRSREEAARDCRKDKKDRERRALRVLDWVAWERNEIENYLLEEAVLLPVMRDTFGCTDQDVLDQLALSVEALRVCQVFQYVFYRARRSWEASDPKFTLPQQVPFRPGWDDRHCRPVPADAQAVRASLEENLAKWRERFGPVDSDGAAPLGGGPLQLFDRKLEDWDAVDLDSPVWRSDWSGKEILQCVRMGLSGRFGWFDPQTTTRVPKTWEDLNRAGRDAQDRLIEDALRPHFAREFVDWILSKTETKVGMEFSSLAESLRRWSDETIQH